MIKISLHAEGLFDRAKLQAWTEDMQRRNAAAAGRAMRAFAKEEVAKIRTDVERAFKVKRRNFVTSFHGKVFDAKPLRMPSMVIGTKIKFAGIFETGGVVSAQGKKGLLIPMNGVRMGYARFRNLVANLLRSKQAFFRQVGGRILLFARNVKGAGITGFTAALRRERGGRVKRGEEIPIAVLVPQVTLTKRLNVEATVRGDLPRLAKLIEQELAKA